MLPDDIEAQSPTLVTVSADVQTIDDETREVTLISGHYAAEIQRHNEVLCGGPAWRLLIAYV